MKHDPIGPVAKLLFATATLTTLLVWGCSSSSSGIQRPHPDLVGSWVIDLSQSDEVEPGLGNLLQTFVAFRIEESDSSLTLSGADGIDRVLVPDGEERASRLPGLGVVRIRSRWKGQKLVVERQLASGPKITETFQLNADGRQLLVTTKVGGVQQTIEFRRIYNAAEQPL